MRFHQLVFSLVVLIAAACPAAAQAGGDRPEYTILRTTTPIEIDGRLDEPAWFAAADVGPFSFPRYEGGKQEQTVVKLLWDDENLYASFLVQDAHISATRTERDADVWYDDAVEIFGSPDPARLDAYFNIEMNALGVFLDQFRPQGRGSNQGEWNGEGVRVKTAIVGTLNDDGDEDEYWVLEVAVPFANFQGVAVNTPPRPGDRWRMGLNRLGGQTNPQASQWSPSLPNFHQPEQFGHVIFSERSVPF